MKGDARSAGGMRISSRHRRAKPPADKGYLTQREARDMFRTIRAKEQGQGIFRRWNDRQLTPEEQKLAAKAQKKKPAHKPRKRPRKRPTPQH